MKGILWAILLCGSFYFVLGVAYNIGYKKGVSEVKCGPAQCTSLIITAEKACLKRVGFYK